MRANAFPPVGNACLTKTEGNNRLLFSKHLVLVKQTNKHPILIARHLKF